MDGFQFGFSVSFGLWFLAFGFLLTSKHSWEMGVIGINSLTPGSLTEVFVEMDTRSMHSSYCSVFTEDKSFRIRPKNLSSLGTEL